MILGGSSTSGKAPDSMIFGRGRLQWQGARFATAAQLCARHRSGWWAVMQHHIPRGSPLQQGQVNPPHITTAARVRSGQRHASTLSPPSGPVEPAGPVGPSGIAGPAVNALHGAGMEPRGPSQEGLPQGEAAGPPGLHSSASQAQPMLLDPRAHWEEVLKHIDKCVGGGGCWRLQGGGVACLCQHVAGCISSGSMPHDSRPKCAGSSRRLSVNKLPNAPLSAGLLHGACCL